MKYQKYLKLILLSILLIPFVAHAEAEEEGEVVAKSIKYYRTTITYSNSSVLGSNAISQLSSFVTELTEEEYERETAIYVDQEIDPYIIVGNEYCKLETTITKNLPYYRYKAVLTWTTIPTVRSYDIMGIGYYASVKPSSIKVFKQEYCNTDGNCYTSTAYTNYLDSNGYGALFVLPSGTLSSLKQTIYAEMEKTNSSSTIVSQLAAGDYAHANRQVSYSAAKDFIIDSQGIDLGAGIISMYSNYSTATAYWSGTW